MKTEMTVESYANDGIFYVKVTQQNGDTELREFDTFREANEFYDSFEGDSELCLDGI